MRTPTTLLAAAAIAVLAAALPASAAAVKPGPDVLLTWAPGPQLIVGASNGIFAVAEPGNIRRITAAGGEFSYPRWSPDARWIAFARDSGIWLVRVDGGGLRRVARDGIGAEWSADGRRLAYLNPSGGIWTVRSDGSMARRVGAFQSEEPWFAWDPNGARLAFTSCITPAGPACERRVNDAVYLVEAAGGKRQRVSRTSGHIVCLAWTRRGLLYVVGSDVIAVNLTARTEKRLFRLPGDGCPEWSPDGNRFAIYGRYGLVVGTIAGRARTVARYRDDVLASASPVWSRDGRRIAFVRSALNGPHRVYVVSADGGPIRRLLGS